MIFRKSILPILALMTAAGPALSAPCSNTGAEYESWKPVMAQEAAAAGVGERGLAALMGSSYASKTIAADRNQIATGGSARDDTPLKGLTADLDIDDRLTAFLDDRSGRDSKRLGAVAGAQAPRQPRAWLEPVCAIAGKDDFHCPSRRINETPR